MAAPRNFPAPSVSGVAKFVTKRGQIRSRIKYRKRISSRMRI